MDLFGEEEDNPPSAEERRLSDEMDKYSLSSSTSSPSSPTPWVSSSQQTTLWVGGGRSVHLFSLAGDSVLHSVSLAGLRAGARELLIYRVGSKDFILVFGECGGLYVYPGHPAKQGCGVVSLEPVLEVQLHVGGVTGVLEVGEHLVTVGEDRRLRCWVLEAGSGGEEVQVREVEGESEVFLGRPVGVVSVAVREKIWLWVGLEDGALVRQEVLGRGWQEVAGSRGRALLRLSAAGGAVLCEEAGGEVSLWSGRGSQLGDWERRSSAAMLWGEGEKQRLLLAGPGGLERLDPGRGACSRVLGGHTGPLSALLGGPGALITAGKDGRLRSWPWVEGIEEPYDPVVGVEDISQTPGSLNDFLVLGAGGSVTWWQWGAGEARVRARAEETLQEARTMARALPARAFLRTSCLAPVLSTSLVQEGRIFLVTVAPDCCLSLHEVSLQREGRAQVSLQLVGQCQLGGRPGHLQVRPGGQAGCFTVGYSLEDQDQHVDVAVDLPAAATRPNLLFKMLYQKEVLDERSGVRKVGEREYRVADSRLVLGQGGRVREEREGRVRVRWLHSARVTQLAGLGEGLVASAGRDARVKVWRVGEGGWEQEGEFRGRGAAPTVITGGEGRVVVGDAAGTVSALQLWPRD